MIKTMRNVSRKAFERINMYPVSNPPNAESSAYVSIYGNDPFECVKPRINRNLWLKGIQLRFDDVDSDEPENNLHLITDEQADLLVAFLKETHSCETEVDLVIHCWAGVSRSAAVGKFANDLFKLDLPNYSRLMLYNRAVYSQLLKAWQRLLDNE